MGTRDGPVGTDDSGRAATARSPGGRGALLVLGILVVLAGCSGLGVGGGPAPPAETVTPVAVATETPTATATESAGERTFAWLVEGGLDLATLRERHVRTLGNRSFTLVRTRRATGTAGAPDAITATYERRATVANDTTYARYRVGTRHDGVVRTYVDPTGLYRRVDHANGSVSTGTAGSLADDARAHFAGLTGTLVDIFVIPGATDVGFTDRGGTTYARLFSTTPPEYLLAVNADYTVRNYTATVWIHPDGYVRSVYYEYTLLDPGVRVDVAVRYSYEDVGSVTLDRPEWVRTLARDGTVTPDPSVAGTRTAADGDTGTDRANRTTGTDRSNRTDQPDRATGTAETPGTREESGG